MPRKYQYATAVGAAALLAFPFVCAMFLLVTFGLGALWLLAVMAIVFGAPVVAFVLKDNEANREKKSRIWHAWTLSLIVHAGASAGLCRVMEYMPNSQFSSEGRSFAQDYVFFLLLPVSVVWSLASAQK